MASKTFYSNKYGPRQLRLELTQYQDIPNNRSRIHWKFISEGSNSSATLFLVYATTIKINGTQVYYKGDTQWYGTGSPSNPVAVFPAAEGSREGDTWVTHNNDGSLSIPIYFYTGVYASKYKADYGGTFTLDKIPRGATITAADNFNDEGNPTVTYSNPAGTAVESLDIALYNTDGSASYAGYRAASKTGSSYTFNLTDAERTNLRKAATGNSLNVRFYLRTTIAGNTFYSHIDKTMTIVNGEPALSVSIVDTNATTTAITKDSKYIVKYFSNAQYTITATPKKESTIKSYKATNNGASKTTASGTFNAVESSKFDFAVTDSRGNTTTLTQYPSYVDYVKLTCNQHVEISAEGVASLDINGNYFNGNIGNTANTLTVQYRYKLQGGNYTDWATATATKSGNTYEAHPTISGLDYQKAYVFQCRAVDKLCTTPSDERTVKALPVFDWGENDFHIHGDLIVEGTITHSNATAAMVLDDGGDSVIESGNTGSYAYRKWSSGLMEAWRSATSAVSVTSSSTSGALYFTDQVTLKTNGAAAQFVSLENVQISVNKNGAVGLWQPIIARTNVTDGAASADVFFMNTVKDASVSIVPYVYFIGRWK